MFSVDVFFYRYPTPKTGSEGGWGMMEGSVQGLFSQSYSLNRFPSI